ncbi:MAG: transcriptional regulator [Chloroflexi bacterium]|nr:transcriptional regulator [Chloroflexota bacterium]
MPHDTRQRLKALIALLQRHPDGLTTSEIGDHFGVTRQTALNDIKRLEQDGIPLYEEKGRYILDPTYNHNIHLSLAQAWFLYLPLRRMVRARMHRIPLVHNLLHTITALFDSEVADQLAPNMDDPATNKNQVFTTLVEGWRGQYWVDITYLRPNADRASQLSIAPWWFEPGVWNDAFYVVGMLASGEQLLTLKLDRIQSAVRQTTRFDRPSGQEITALLEETWGIWLGEGSEATLVQLKFHNRQYDRLHESVWHPSQRITMLGDGFILWEGAISEPQEMLPWIRGWGADVEVLAPDDIRQQVASEAEATARLYNRNADDEPSFF